MAETFSSNSRAKSCLKFATDSPKLPLSGFFLLFHPSKDLRSDKAFGNCILSIAGCTANHETLAARVSSAAGFLCRPNFKRLHERYVHLTQIMQFESRRSDENEK
jgi:hypothetical protein